MITLSHRSPEKGLEIIEAKGLFNGMFCCYGDVSENHGCGKGFEYLISIPEGSVAYHSDINGASDELIDSVIASDRYGNFETDEELEAVRSLIREQTDACDDDLGALSYLEDDRAELVWMAQRMRGEIARLLGFKAVECHDEYGTSVLVLSGAKLTLNQ